MGTVLNNLLFRLFAGKPLDVPVTSFRVIRRSLVNRALALPVSYAYLSAMLFACRPAVTVHRYPPPPETSPGGGKSLFVASTQCDLLEPVALLGTAASDRAACAPAQTACVTAGVRLMRLMILGGGSSQITVFRRARELGIETVLADRDPKAPARSVADHFADASTFDPDAVTDAAGATRCDAILAVGTDQPVYTAAVVSHRLGLPFPLTPEQAIAVTNKRVMKARFDETAIPAAPWGLFRPGTDPWQVAGLAALRPPFVVKPVDSQGQRGIIRAADRAAVEAHYPVARSFSREDGVLVEEYIPSVEVTVSGWAHTPQEVEFWTITDRVTIDNPPGLGVCLAHRFPSLHAADRSGDQIERIRDLTRRIVTGV